MKKSVAKRMLYTGTLFMLIGCLSIGTFALYTREASSENNIENSISVSIEDGTNLSDDQIEIITDAVISYHCNHVTVEGSTSYGLTCVLLGHDSQTNMVSVIEHKVRASNPRCLETKYKVTTCSRCDYENIEYVLEKYISCCD